MNITKIVMSSAGGALTATISCPTTPQSVVGVVFRYNSDQSFDKKMGLFKTDSPDINLGSPIENDGKLFMIQGTVINFNDDPPSPYKVVVDISQNGNVLSTEVPSDGGSGKIGDKDIAFAYNFSLQNQ